MFKQKMGMWLVVIMVLNALFCDQVAARHVFEKGDAIYSDFGNVWTPLWFVGHAGLYAEWVDPDDPSNPDDLEKHKVWQSNPRPSLAFLVPLGFPVPLGVNDKMNFKQFEECGTFWSVRTTDLTAAQRRTIVETVQARKNYYYHFFWGYKGPNTFRCDGLVEYCYEKAGIDIMAGDTWSPVIAALPGRVLLTPWQQMRRLDRRTSAELWKVTLGKYDECAE